MLISYERCFFNCVLSCPHRSIYSITMTSKTRVENSFLCVWPQFWRALMEQPGCSSQCVGADSTHHLVRSLDCLVLSDVALLGLLGPLPCVPPRLSARAETRARIAELTPSCSCPLAFLQSVLFDALCKGRVEKPGLFIKGLLLCYLYFREQKSLKPWKL